MNAPYQGSLDWESAAWWARSLTPAGPTVTRDQARLVAKDLRAAAAAAPGIVAEITGLSQASHQAETFPRLVVDRAGWAEANVAMFADLTAGHLPGETGFGSQQMAAMELGAMLGLLSTKILGQFDPFSTRLYLVAPNIIALRRVMGVSQEDFAAWVALHEQTHAVQFAAAPWLPEYMRSTLGELLEAMSEDQWVRMWRFIRNLPSSLRPRQEAVVGALTQAALSPAELAGVERLVAVMSLLEGHADVVMDGAQEIIPSTKDIRRKFTRRRKEPTFMGALVRRLTGMDAKLRQYRDGAVFVNGVIEVCGHEGLNRVFGSPEMLPTPAEIADPGLWVARVGT